jgi:hypothetical protein
MEVVVDGMERPRGGESASELDSLLERRKIALETPDTTNPFRDTPVEPENLFYRYIKVHLFPWIVVRNCQSVFLSGCCVITFSPSLSDA